jgi:c-di-GMP-binding flagellar brake protein YcgR
MSKASRIPIRTAEIKVGAPLPWSVYDENGTLLLTAGHVPASESQVESLIARGIYRTESAGAPGPEKAAAAKPAAGIAPATPAGDPIQFDDLSLQPGEMLQLHPALEVAGDFMPSVMLGYLKNQTIIVTNPIVGGKVVPVKEGDPYHVKAFSGTNLFSFRTKVAKVYAQPYAHLHLEYPKLVYATKIRKALRSVVNLPAVLRNLATQAATEVLIKDLSAGGAKLVLHANLGEKEARYALSFKIKLAEDLESEVTAIVVAKALETQTIKGVVTHMLGVQFQDLEKEARLLVLALVYRQHLGKG